jgi:hypothetical protein
MIAYLRNEMHKYQISAVYIKQTKRFTPQ